MKSGKKVVPPTPCPSPADLQEEKSSITTALKAHNQFKAFKVPPTPPSSPSSPEVVVVPPKPKDQKREDHSPRVFTFSSTHIMYSKIRSGLRGVGISTEQGSLTLNK